MTTARPSRRAAQSPRAAEKRMAQELRSQLSELDGRIRTDAIRSLASRLVATFGGYPDRRGALIAGLTAAAASACGAIRRLELRRAQLMVDHRSAATEPARRAVLEKALTSQSTSPAELRRDLRALDRYLDLEAIQERLAVSISAEVDLVEVAYRCAMGIARDLAGSDALLDAFGAGRTVNTAFEHADTDQREAVRRAALAFLNALLSALPKRERLRTVGAAHSARLRDWSEGRGTRGFLQVEALKFSCTLHDKRAMPTLQQLLADRTSPDGAVVRRNALALAFALELEPDEAEAVADLVLDDPSEHVRQQLAESLAAAPHHACVRRLRSLSRHDESPRVRGLALRCLVSRSLLESLHQAAAEERIVEALQDGTSSVERAIALESVARLCLGAQAPCPQDRFAAALEQVTHSEACPADQCHKAAQLLRGLEVASAPLVGQVQGLFAATLATLSEGRRTRLTLPAELPLASLELALCTAAAGDLSVSLRKLRPKVVELRRGEPRRLRLWRLLHELTHPAPDKRKAHAHSHGRSASRGSVVPSQLLAEVTETRVPGERRLHPALGGWAPFLPRVDDMLSAASLLAAPLRIVTTLGVLTVSAPAGIWQRIRAQLLLTIRYARFDQLREQSLKGKGARERLAFVRAMEGLGFALKLGGTSGMVGETRVNFAPQRFTRYLAAGAWLPDLRHYLEGPLVYVLSPTGNAPWHLALLVWLVLAGFLIRSAVVMGSIESARRAIPLSVGGWGTRGKSGTERLKAALFHAMRYDVVVKTTGCEAMFIHARRDMPAREIFLYRPYDKATIWEQRKVLEYAQRLQAQVFLWECMALNPHFVEVLNRDWMQDEVTTLTNAYPDHEDIMGPSGEDVARVIGLFTPIKGVTYTAEEQMLPILREVARSRGTELVPVTALEADLLPADILARFPYDEHPRNIALVLRLAEHYGIDREQALLAMADGVVPDLGVLKTYPQVQYRGRVLEFSNGMSANERAGFLSNWSRLGFDRMDRSADPELVSVAVINNRADRIARSRVFADIMARDVNVSHMVLIGTNLSGMRQFIEEAVEQHLSTLSFEADEGADGAQQRLSEWFDHVGAHADRQAFRNQVERMVAAMLGPDDARTTMEELGRQIDQGEAGLGEAVKGRYGAQGKAEPQLLEDVLQHIERLRLRFDEVERCRVQVLEQVAAGSVEAAAATARTALKRLSLARLHVLEQADAKGDRVVDFVASVVEPGHHARILGCQNIKGTGLDFVYRWLSLLAVTDTLSQIEAQAEGRAESLTWLNTYSDYGLMDAELALRRIQTWIDSEDDAWAPHRSLLEGLRDTLQELVQKKRRGLVSTGRKSGLWERFLGSSVEPLIDHWDSTRRTRLSEQVTTDLFALRVGQGRAALLLRELVARQKGGWLHQQVQAAFRRGRP